MANEVCVCLPNQWLALSYDASFLGWKECKCNMGWVLRDRTGVLIAMTGQVVRDLFNVLFVEVWAIVVSLQVKSSIVQLSFMVETDNLTKVQLLIYKEKIVNTSEICGGGNSVHENATRYLVSSHSTISEFGG